MPHPIYFDHNATTPLLPNIRENLVKFLTTGFGNPSSVHWAGRVPKQILRETRQKLAQYLGCSPSEIIFTSGASESNNTVVRALVEQREKNPLLKGRRVILTSNIEHPSLQSILKYYEEQGQIQWIQCTVNQEGCFPWDHLKEVVSQRAHEILLVSVMGANNETGLVLPVEAIASYVRERGLFFHSDMTQVFCKAPISLSHLDYMSLSSHKAYALKGCGVLWVRKGAPFAPLILGGSQERYRRAGTENILAIASLGLVLDHMPSMGGFTGPLLEPLQRELESRLLKQIPGIRITHGEGPRLPNTTHLIIEGVDSETLLMNLDLKGYAVSAGSACSSGSTSPSGTVMALGFTSSQAQQSLRVSLGLSNTLDEIIRFVEDLAPLVQRLRASGRESEKEGATL
jgi:cysteine desulfurase